MVHAPESRHAPTTIEAPSSHNPSYEQPYQTLGINIGIPGSVLCSVATMFLVFIGVQGHSFEAWTAITVMWTAYFAAMGLLWAAAGSEGSAR